MTEERRRQEINEAVRAGEKTLVSLRAAQSKLASARNWGIWDMLGGGLITSMIKHSRIDDASSYLESARTDLKIFQRELKDISDFSELWSDVGGFLSFADLLLDVIISDWIVQVYIGEAIKPVDSEISRVGSIIIRLRAEKLV